MAEEERPYGLGLSTTAVEKRRRQLEAWRNSDTNLEPGRVVYRSSSKVKFSKGVMLFAAVSNGDEKEVERLITEENANPNYTNNDGLTAIHQVSSCYNILYIDSEGDCHLSHSHSIIVFMVVCLCLMWY